MTTRKLLYLTLFCASTTIPAQWLPGRQAQLSATDACPQCSMQLVAPTIALNQLYL